MKFEFKAEYKEKIYKVEMIDFVNERVGFTIVNDEMKPEGVHVALSKVDLILK